VADAILVGTGTVLADDPSLTARRPGGTPAAHQPLRVAMGRRAVPESALIRASGSDAGFLQIRSHDPVAALEELNRREARRVIVEGGPTVAAAFLAAGLVDEVHAYVEPMVLGAGLSAVASAVGAGTLADAPRFRLHSVSRLGNTVLIEARAAHTDRTGAAEPKARTGRAGSAGAAQTKTPPPSKEQ
jgi:diaminohydroxyphosphoribosylaminopyrimidine deaminase/5-amino-6-(5-phosphoribosylamino)uracil reductase